MASAVNVSTNEIGAMPTTDGQDNHAGIHGQSPKNASQRQISLGKRAPAEPIPERTWKFYLDVSKGLYSYEDVLSQRNQCIRSQRGYTKAHFECGAQKGTHDRVELDINGAADLQFFLHTYKQWRVPEHIALAWGDWIHQELNNNSHDVLNGKYSLELVLGWSVTRIAVVILIPVVLSLVIGLWFNSKDWTDLTTIQTAWSIASYIVTAGGFVAALLGIMSSLADK
ncbi:hypothetical protein CFIO01_05740 [Colletotrichum fioriniae PJ7]|uniref:Uncharacterized protein n=1 Tax=Colletotrichum fioriniae PJ7 TaxID=1445577 RepID=A0A010R7Z2_9PEZI|nr:hypothetical protein CFIO01_05740 [Colletotrichum fioriniae PJ7]